MKSLIEDSICDVINNYPSFFFDKRNVLGIGYGNKMKKNIITNEPTIHVLVKEKLPLNQLYPHEIIPQNFLGLKTDIIETGVINQDMGTKPREISVLTIGKENSEVLKEIRGRIRPIQGGLSIGPENSKTYGTLGAIVHGIDDDLPYILSAGHVLTKNGKNKKGSKIYQPSRVNCSNTICRTFNDLIKKNIVAKLSKWTPINYDENADNYMDAGIAKVYDNVPFKRGIYHDNSFIKGQKEMAIKKYMLKVGASSGYTMTRILSLHLTIKIQLLNRKSYMLKDQASSIKISNSGDSGSLIFDDDDEKALAIIVASSDRYSFFTPIIPILKALHVYFDY